MRAAALERIGGPARVCGGHVSRQGQLIHSEREVDVALPSLNDQRLGGNVRLDPSLKLDQHMSRGEIPNRSRRDRPVCPVLADHAHTPILIHHRSLFVQAAIVLANIIYQHWAKANSSTQRERQFPQKCIRGGQSAVKRCKSKRRAIANIGRAGVSHVLGTRCRIAVERDIIQRFGRDFGFRHHGTARVQDWCYTGSYHVLALHRSSAPERRARPYRPAPD